MRGPEIRPRDIPTNPRCADCKTEDPKSGHPMFHPAHRGQRCWVRLQGGEQCPCTSDRVLKLGEHDD
jgi:hypothetical protein